MKMVGSGKTLHHIARSSLVRGQTLESRENHTGALYEVTAKSHRTAQI
jgi:hypothetical protein